MNEPMPSLCCLFDELMSFRRLARPAKDSFEVQGLVYTNRGMLDEGLVFYNWIIDESDAVRGFEIHLPSDHPLLASKFPLREILEVEIDPFVTIWFGNHRTGTARVMEAFGDIEFFATSDDRLAIVVGFDWLSHSQMKSVLTQCHGDL